MENSSNIITPSLGTQPVVNKETSTDFTYLNSPINKEQMISVEPVVKMIQQKAITKQKVNSSMGGVGGGVSDISFSSVNNRDVDRRIKTFDSSTPFNDVYKQFSDGEVVKRYDTFMPGIDNAEYAAQNQSTSDKWLNGLTKAAVNFGTTVAGNTVGLLYGIGNGIAEGSLNAVFDNKFTNYVADLNEKLDYKLPNYVSKDEQDDNFFESATTANFWAKDVAGAFSFTLGTAVSEAIWAVATGGAANASRRALEASQAINATKNLFRVERSMAGLASAKKIVGDASKLLFTGKIDDVLKAGVSASNWAKRANTGRFLLTTSGNEAGIEALHFKRESRENFYNNFEKKNGRAPSADDINEFEDKLGNSANAVFATNMAILAPSNLAMFGSAFNIASPFKGMAKGANKALFGIGTELVEEGGKKVFKGIVASGKQKVARYAYAGLKPLVTEGLYEEGLQGVTTNVAKQWMESGYDPKYNNQTIALADATYKAFGEQYGTKEGWKEIGIGGIVGGVSSVVAGGGKFEEIKEFNNQQEYQDKIVAGGMNKYGDNTTQATRNIAQQFFFNSRVISANERQIKAIKEGDDIGYALADQDKLVSEIQYRKGIGEDPKELISKYETALNSMPKEEYEKAGITDIEGYNNAILTGYKNVIESHEKASKFADAIIGDTGIMGIDSKTMETQELKNGLTRSIVSGQLANKAMDSILQDMGEIIGKDTMKAQTIQKEMSRLGKNTQSRVRTLNKSIEQADKERVILSAELEKLQIAKDENKAQRLLAVQTKLTQNLEKSAELKSQREELARDVSQESKRRRGVNLDTKNTTDKNGNATLLNEYITGEDLANLDKNLQKIEDTIKSYEGVNHEVYYDLLESKRQYGLAKDRFMGYQDAIDGIVSGNFKPNYAKVSPFWQKIFMQKQGIDDFSKTYLENILQNYKNFGDNLGVEDVTTAMGVTDEEYTKFVETAEVSDEIKAKIAQTIKDKGELSKRAKEIYDANYDEINNLNKVKVNPNKPDLSPEASIDKEIEALEKEKADLLNSQQNINNTESVGTTSEIKYDLESIKKDVENIVNKGEPEKNYKPITKEDKYAKVDFNELVRKMFPKTSDKEALKQKLKQHLKETHPDKTTDVNKKEINTLFTSALLEVAEKNNIKKLDELFEKYKELTAEPIRFATEEEINETLGIKNDFIENKEAQEKINKIESEIEELIKRKKEEQETITKEIKELEEELEESSKIAKEESVDVEDVEKLTEGQKESAIVSNGLTITKEDSAEDIEEIIERNNQEVIDNVISDNLSEEDKQTIAKEESVDVEDVEEFVKEEVKKAIKNNGNILSNLSENTKKIIKNILKFLLGGALIFTLAFNSGNVRNKVSRVVSDYTSQVAPKDSISFNESTFSVTSFDGCSAYVSNQVKHTIGKEKFSTFGFFGDAWTINDNLVKSGNGNYVFNTFSNFNKKSGLSSDEIRKEVKSIVVSGQQKLDINMFQEGDIVNLFYEGSNFQKEAYEKGKGSYTSHIGIIKRSSTGELVLEHNIHGIIKKDNLLDLISGKIKSVKGSMLVSAIVRPTYEKIGLSIKTLTDKKENAPIQETSLGAFGLLLLLKRRQNGEDISEEEIESKKQELEQKISDLKSKLETLEVNHETKFENLKSEINSLKNEKPNLKTTNEKVIKINPPTTSSKETQEKINKIDKQIQTLQAKKRGTLTEAEKVREQAEAIMERDFPLITYDLEELIGNQPTKTEMQRYQELFAKKDKLNLFESKEFEELQPKMQKWFTAESLPSVGGMSLAEVVEYLAQLETQSEKENTLVESPFESILGVEDAVELVNEKILQNRAGSATTKIIKDGNVTKIFFSGLNVKTIIDRLVENGITQAEIKVVVKDKNGKEKLIKKDLTDALLKENTEILTVGTEFLIGDTKIVIGARGNMVMDLEQYNKVKDVINVHYFNTQTGSWSWTDAYEELPNGDRVKIKSQYNNNTDSDSIYDVETGDDLQFYVDMNTDFNYRLKTDALEELDNNGELSKEIKDKILKLLEITSRRKGVSNSTLKATGDKVTDDNFMLIRKRYTDEFVRILEEQKVLATLPNKIDLQIEAPISEIFLGTPDFILDNKNESKELPITEAGLQRWSKETPEGFITQGYVQDKEIVLADKKVNVDKVTRLYVSNLAKKNPGVKIPVVLLQKGVHLFVFPINLIQTPISQEDKFQTILEKFKDISDNILKLNKIKIATNNLLISLGSNTRLTGDSDVQFENIREELKNYKTGISAEQLASVDYDKMNLINDATSKIDFANTLISSPKITVDFSKATFGTKIKNETNAANVRQEIVKELAEIEKILLDTELADDTRFAKAFAENDVKNQGSDIMNRSDVNFIKEAFFNSNGKIAINANDKAVIAIGKDKLLVFRKKLEKLAWYEYQIKVINKKNDLNCNS